LPAVNASRTVILPSRCQYGKKHRRFVPRRDWVHVTAGTR
jgi:hypothetical protein